ncbi:Dihydropteroate synthase [Gloeomargarita lithophora Alchichica-D10]|uniref:Dihydropteroate synthase n=1 Tax=Gloeomargarita lithophora Alchichica-D10 TaxID=1188229 RepID=A0A1J0A9F0_9CYAN|nr:Dihydropteroate synthase [Gloeomargarita lithophora Alchichica-D10]
MFIDWAEQIRCIDTTLSKRHLDLDPAGYFIIYIDPQEGYIYAKWFTNAIDKRGLALDPSTGQPIPARGGVKREPNHIFRGRTAKELCVEIFEECHTFQPVSQLGHAAYLGREFLRAEMALVQGTAYTQD